MPRLAFVLLLVTSGTYAAPAALRVAVISDLNGSYGTTSYEATVAHAIERILTLQPDLVISTGDMVAGQRRPHLSRPKIKAMWAAFHANVSEPLARAGIPLAVTPGNHDASAYKGFEDERATFAEQWSMRQPAVTFVDRAHYPFRYAFRIGDVLFVSLDATTSGHLSATQVAWLDAVLTGHGSSYTHRVVFGHLPVWPFAEGREQEYIGNARLQGLLESAKVELVLSGHHHAFYPGSRGEIAFVGQACLGAGPRRLLGESGYSGRGFTLIELGDGPPQVTAYTGPALGTSLDWNSLPPRLLGPAGEITRADLAGTARPGSDAFRSERILFKTQTQ